MDNSFFQREIKAQIQKPARTFKSLPKFIYYWIMVLRWAMCQVDFLFIIPALSKESSGILLLPLSVRPSVRKKSLSLELRLHFKDLRNDTLGSHWVCLVDVQ